MKAETWVRVSTLFQRALDVQAAERTAFLDGACAGEPEVRVEVERLLRLDQEPGATLDAAQVLSAALPAPAPGTRIGRYRLERVLASGGMGTVFEAVQDEPRRTVALKTLRVGLSAAARLARFRLEAEVLGALRHPCIAQVYEAGMHDAAGETFPWFAMELVAGASDLLSYARERGLPTRRAIELFLDVCDAVHHGHQKGVIHRDLKPGNVLVDAEGRVKVIDFGVARVVGPDAEARGATEAGQILGTLAYMSPEQLAGDPAQVDVRADVYALGVVLHELLTGRPPYELGGLSLHEAGRRIRELVPARPHCLPRELGWVVLRTLEKDPERRYASVSELAADLRRFLTHEPVLAGPPSAAYRLGLLARRHRLPLAATAAVIVALAVGLVRAERSAQAEARARARAEDLARAESRARTEAERQERKARWVSDFLSRTLSSVSPDRRGQDARVVDVLDEASRAVGSLETDDPEIRAAAHEVLGQSYDALGLFAEADPHFEAARAFAERQDPPGPFALQLLASYGEHLSAARRLAEAEAWCRELLPVAERTVGPGGDAAVVLRYALSNVLFALDRLDEAEALAQDSLRLLAEEYGEDDERLVTPLYLLAQVALRRGASHADEAAERVQRALEPRRWRVRSGHEGPWHARELLAGIHESGGRWAEAEPLRRALLDWCRGTLGDRHPATVHALAAHARTLYGTGAFEGAREAYEDAREAVDAIHGAESLEGVRARSNLSLACSDAGRAGEALAWAEEGMEIARRVLPPGHGLSLRLRAARATALDASGDARGAEAVLRELLPDAEAALGPADPFVLEVVAGLARALAARGDLEGVRAMALELERRAPQDEARATLVRGLVDRLEHPAARDAGGDG